ncbi:hypothetical protein [Aequorivita lipolytica]|uniref:Uncharacterized protein n=1 Tax=Aequorivita lipolytica TaxID=153267 RepID=A0A5C6YN21_9FLAO|nr:hypothetical protein [Aequorivita lipolytica]TXD68972.1 hypothetical protein ESV24_09475 [Aequorivita lipolytica]SRX53032.1 hypothetical protein AEQU2_02279 [Aequorivita lipolytica]
MINLDNLENFDNLNDLNKELQRRANIYNENGVDYFEGLSPTEMQQLHYHFPTGESPLVINKLSEEQLKDCPLLMQLRFLIDKMKGGKELKLTKTGALPTKLVKEIYDLGYLKNEMIEKGIGKLYKEDDAQEISITRILLQISNLAKKKNGTLSLTKKGEKYAADGNVILKEILTVLFTKFNWAYYDGYESETIGQINPAFSLFLLKKYGVDKRSVNFYAEKYFNAFPQLKSEDNVDFRCYATRTFDRYFYFMGFIKKEKKDFLGPIELEKTKFFDQLFSEKSL